MDWIWLMVPVFIGLVMAGSVKFIRPRERGLVERFGKYNRFANPGLKIVLLGVERLLRVNITEQMVDAARQEVITKDNLNAQVDAQIYYKILKSEENVKNSQYNVDDIDVQIIQLSRTTLRDIIGNMKLIEVNSKRNQVNDSLAKDLREQTKNWGIEVVRAELKEIEPPGPVQSAMNQVVVAENEKMAAVDFATAKETEADGERRAEIKVAEGRKQAAILIAEGKARAIKDVNESARKYFVGNAQPYKRLEVANNVLKNNTKIIVPEKSDLVNVVDGLIGGVIPVKKKGGK